MQMMCILVGLAGLNTVQKWTAPLHRSFVEGWWAHCWTVLEPAKTY